MTTYTPYPKVIFDGGIEYADNTISRISISLGRRDIYEQPQPGLATIELFTDANTPLNIGLADSVKVQIKKPDNTYATIYTGQVTDMDIAIDQYGETGNLTIYKISALGVLSLLNKRLAGEFAYAKEYDGTRVYNILHEAFVQSYDEVSPALKYSDVPADISYNSYDGASAPVIDTLDANITQPGFFELTAYSGGSSNALNLAQDAAQSGRGILYEGPDGALYYDDWAKRATYTAFTLTADDIQADSLATNSQWSEIVNDVTVTYKNNQSYNAVDGTSQLVYGQLTGTRNTQLEKGADAYKQALDFVDARSFPQIYPEAITIPLHSPTVSDTTRDNLIELLVGRPVFTNDLPAVFGTEFNGFVEGIKWNLTRYTADITLTCSAVSETYPHIIWLQVPTNVMWKDYNHTIRWKDL